MRSVLRGMSEVGMFGGTILIEEPIRPLNRKLGFAFRT